MRFSGNKHSACTNSLLKEEAETHGDRLHVIPADRLADLKKEIELFSRDADLNDFQKWIVNHFYNYAVPDTSFTVHHACYDCLRCQDRCPMNVGHTRKTDECFVFPEAETEMLLQGSPIDAFPEEARQKIFRLGLNDWYAAMPRNIKALMNNR